MSQQQLVMQFCSIWMPLGMRSTAGLFPVEDSQAYGEAFELRNVTDYEMLGHADRDQAHTVVESAKRFVERCRIQVAKF